MVVVLVVSLINSSLVGQRAPRCGAAAALVSVGHRHRGRSTKQKVRSFGRATYRPDGRCAVF